jgi:hypothetical protein
MNVTFNEQLAPGSRLVTQFVQKEKEPGLVPETVILPVGRVCVVELLIVMVWAVPGVKTFASPKLSELGQILSAVAELVVWVTLNVTPAIFKLPYWYTGEVVEGATENWMAAGPVPDWLLVTVNHVELL